MSSVTGTVQSAGLVSMAGLSVCVIFTLSGVGIQGDVTIPTLPIRVTPDIDGQYTASLASTADMLGNRYYQVLFEYADAAGEYQYTDDPGWELRVPLAGGDVADLLAAPLPAGVVAFGPTVPPGLQVGEYFVDTDTGIVYLGG